MKHREELLLKKIKTLSREKKKIANKISLSSGVADALQAGAYSAEYDLEGKVLSVSPKLTQLLEIDSLDIVGKFHKNITLQNVDSEEYKSIWKKLKDGLSQNFIEEVSVLGNKKRLLNQTFTPVKNNSGKVIRIFSLSFDLTGELKIRREISEKLEKLATEEKVLKRQIQSFKKEKKEADIIRERLDLFADSINSAFLRIDYSPEGEVIEVNDRYLNITGLKRGNVIGTNIKKGIPEEDLARFNQSWSEVLKGEIVNEIITITTTTRESVKLLKSDIPLINRKGETEKVMFVAIDITSTIS